jgi:nucleotide-binding universal stress UspA family protein
MGSCRIVVGVDGPLGSGPATDWAAERAALETGRLVLLHVDDGQRTAASLPPVRTAGTGSSGAAAADLDEPTGALLTATAQRLRDRRPAVEVVTRQVHGRPDEVLGELARDADLVVVGRPQHCRLGWRRSTCRQLLARSSAPLVVVPAVVRDHESPVVVGVDSGEATPAALRFAAREAELRGVPLVAVHAWGDEDRLGIMGGAGLDDELDALVLIDSVVRRYLPATQVSILPLRGGAVGQLLACSWQAQLVVVGRTRRARRRRLGTLPEALLRAGVRAPLAIVP